MADVGGFAGGYMEATQSQDQHAQAMQDLAKGKLDIQMTQNLLDAQHVAQLELAHLGGKAQGAGGQDVSGVAGQSYKASELSFAAGEVYMRQGLVQQGSEFMERGAKLAESAAALETKQAEQQARMWSHVGSAMDLIQPGSQTAQQDWDKVRMTFPLMFPEEAKHPEVQKFLKMPYDPKTVDLLKRASQNAQQQAELAKTKAEAKKNEAETKFNEAGVPLRKAEAAEHAARANAISKAGGKPPPQAEVNNAKSLIQADYPDADPKGYQLYATEIAERAKQLMAADMGRDQAFQQAYSEVKESGKLEKLPPKASAQTVASTEAKQNSINDIDSLLELLDEGEGSVGIGRKFNVAAEWWHTATGTGEQETPQATFDAKLGVLISRLPQALSKKGKLAADERQVIRDISDLKQTFTTSKTGRAKLQALRDRLTGSDDRTIKGKGGPVQIKTDADYDKLPSGTEFVGPDGQKRRKP